MTENKLELTKQKCKNCGEEFDRGYDCGSCTRYIPGECIGNPDNEYCTDCCVKLGGIKYGK